MNPLLSNCILVIVISIAQQGPANAFVKMAPFVSKLNVKMDVRSMNISYAFNNAKSTTNQSFQIDYRIVRPIKVLKLIATFYATDLNGVVKNAPLIKRQVDFCFFMRRPNSDRLVKSIFDYLRAHGKLALKCPLPVGDYYIRDIRPTDVPIPAFLPETSFMLDLTFLSEVREKSVAEVRVYGKLVRFLENLPI